MTPAPGGMEGQMLRPGDAVRLRIYLEPELSSDYVVHVDGTATFPLIGVRTVTSITPDSLRRMLVADYGEYLRDPSIEVIPLRRVRVTGAVRQPGVFMLDPTMSLGDALAEAGGATATGHPDRVLLRRAGEAMAVELSRVGSLDTQPVRSGDELFVPERSWLSRNTGIVAAGMTAAVSLIIALTR